MPHIELGNDQPGIIGLFAYRPETAHPLSALAEVLLRGDNTLTRGERELIATYVSRLNDCTFCASQHGAFAAAQGMTEDAPISDKMRALLRIAECVQVSGKAVGEEEIAAARAAGADDREIHDTVLIAAAFCMYNRYVDGLATLVPQDPSVYKTNAEVVVQFGYLEVLGG